MGWATGWTIGWAMGCGLLFGWVGLFNLLGLGLCYWCWLAVRLGWLLRVWLRVGLLVGLLVDAYDWTILGYNLHSR